MVSVKLLSLPESYIKESRILISILEVIPEINVEYAFWYIRYDDSESWTEGEWRLLIASNICNNGLREAYTKVQEMLNQNSDYTLELSDIELCKPEWDNHKHVYPCERIDVLRPPEE